MATVEELRLAIKAEVADAVGKLKQYERQVKETGKSNETLADSFSSMRDAMQGPVAIAKDVVQAIQKIVAVGVELYTTYAEAERASIVFNQALSDGGSMTMGASTRLRDYASQLQQTTQFEGDNTLAIMGNLAAQGKSEKQITALIEAAANLAAATGVDLDTAVKQLNSTLSGNVGLLGRQNVAIKALTKEQLMNGEAIAIINKQYEGMAVAVGESAYGASEKLKNNFEDLQEALGQVVAYNFSPLIEGMVGAAKEAADRISGQVTMQQVLAGDLKDSASIQAAIEWQQKEIDKGFSGRFAKRSKDQAEERLAQLKALLDVASAMERQQSKASEMEQRAAAEASIAAAEKAAKEAAAAAMAAADEQARIYLVHLQATFGRMSSEYIDPMVEDIAARTARLARAWMPDMSSMRYGEILGEDGVSVKQVYRDLSASVGEAAYAVAKADKIIMEKTAEMVGANVTQIEDYTEAQRELANIVGGAFASSFSALGQALANGETGWEAWAKAGMGAIAGVLEQWATATAVMGFAELFNPLTAASGAAKLLAAAGAATTAGVIRQAAATASTATATTQSVQIVQVQGSVITERQLGRLAASSSRKAKRGW